MAKNVANKMTEQKAAALFKGEWEKRPYREVREALRVLKDTMDGYSYLKFAEVIDNKARNFAKENEAMPKDEALALVNGDWESAPYYKVRLALHSLKENLDAFSYLEISQKMEKQLMNPKQTLDSVTKDTEKKETKKTAKMTVDEALNILKGDLDTYSYSKVQEALEVIKQQDPNNPVLKDFLSRTKNFEKENNLESKDSGLYEKNDRSIEALTDGYSFEKFIKEKNNQDVAKYVERTEVVDSVSGQTLDDKGKKDYLSLLFEGAKLKAQTVFSGSETFAQMSKKDQVKALKDEIKTIFFADFAQAAVASQLSRPTKEEQKIGSDAYKKYIDKQVKTATEIFDGIINGGKAIKVKTDAILSSCADTAIKVENYIKALRHKAQENLLNATRKVSKDTGKVVAKTADKFTLLANSLQKKKNKFEQLANNVSKNRYEIWKNIKGSFSDNKIKLFGNIAANAAFGYWTAAAAAGAATAGAAPVLVPAVAAYAAYHAAGAWVYPIIAEMRKINRKKREAGEKPLPFTQALKQAWKNKMSSRKDKRSYIIGGAINTALAAAGFAWLKDGLEAADSAATLANGAKEGLNVTLASNIAETRHAISLGRAGTATVAQLADASVAYVVSAKDPDNKEKAAEFKQAATAALVGLGLNVAFQAAGFAHGQSHGEVDADDVNVNHDTVKDTIPDQPAKDGEGKGFIGWISRVFYRTDEPKISATDTVTQKDSVAPVVAPVTENISDQSNINIQEETISGLFPKTYSEDMGISKNEYNILVSTTEGTLKSATGEEVTLDRAYMNLDGAMENFPDKTKEEILYKFNRLYAFMRKAYEVGDGTLRETPSGADYLENKFETLNLNLEDDKMGALVRFAQENTYADKATINEGLKEIFPDGLKAKDSTAIMTIIHSNQRFYQHQEEMEALINLLGCGEKITAEQALSINKLLDSTDDLLATGKENTQLTGLSLAKDCHDDDGEWIRVPSNELPKPVLPDVVIEEEPIKVEDTPIDLVKTPIIIPFMVNIPEPDIHVDAEPINVDNTPLHVEPMEAPDERQVRKVVITGMSQLEGETAPEKEKVLSSRKAARMLRRFGQNSKE